MSPGEGAFCKLHQLEILYSSKANVEVAVQGILVVSDVEENLRDSIGLKYFFRVWPFAPHVPREGRVTKSVDVEKVRAITWQDVELENGNATVSGEIFALEVEVEATGARGRARGRRKSTGYWVWIKLSL